MSAHFKHIALVGKYQSPDVAESVTAIARFLRERGLTVWIEQGTASAIGGAEDFPVASYEHIGAEVDLAVVVGGDGTMLHTARRLVEHGVPLAGVNLGRLGFLTDIDLAEARCRLDEIIDGRFSEEHRFMLDAEVLRGEQRMFQTLALNDVVVNKGEIGRMIEFNLFVDGEYVYSQRSDGMIISTPTGSTAYSLSSNGPILHPGVGGIALVPLCPHALTARPITLADSCQIEIELLPQQDARVHFDGQVRFDLRVGDRVRVVRSQHALRLLHPRSYSYFAILREKLHWSTTPREG
ncbi:MAG: NAD kinase [Thauera sp.]|jgi:NAD+ kinase|nr:NAD kinase [Thauera sp.]